MTAKVTKVEYRKELFSIPLDVSDSLKAYAKETHKKKSHIVADAIEVYIRENKRKNRIEEAKSIIGIIKGPLPDIQEIKAHRYDND